jgi:hypothetical protein
MPSPNVRKGSAVPGVPSAICIQLALPYSCPACANSILHRENVKLATSWYGQPMHLATTPTDVFDPRLQFVAFLQNGASHEMLSSSDAPSAET